jgi:hypothetical protein
MEMARCMLYSKEMKRTLWGKEFVCANHIINLTSTWVVKGTSPYGKWYGNKSSVFHFRFFGSSAWAHTPNEVRNILKMPKPCYPLVGYKETFQGYRFYDPFTHQVIEHRDVVFDEVPTHGSP